jgi:hypothetical protein
MLGRDADGDHLRVTPPGGTEFDAWFDPVVHLLVRIREVEGFHPIDQRYNDFEQRAGMTVPITTIIDDGSGPADRQTLRLTSLEIAPARRPSAYAMPTAMPSDWSIDGGAHEVTVPFRLLNNHIFVDATVDGRGPFPFLVDTGGHDILTNPTVQALGLASQGDLQSHGAGEKTASTGYTRVKEIDVGGMRMRDQTVLTLDFSPKEVEENGGRQTCAVQFVFCPLDRA